MLFCGCCEVQLALYVSPVEQSTSKHGPKLFAMLVQTVCEENRRRSRRRTISQHQSVSLLYHSFSIHLTIILLSSGLPYPCLFLSSLQACLCIKHSCFQLVNEIAAAGIGIAPVGLNLAWDMTLFTPNTTLTCNGIFSVSGDLK